MKKILKSRIFLVIITAIVFTGIGVLATVAATSITYTPSWTKANGDPISNVQEALDTLYTKATTLKTPTQVATMTTVGATYTMQNDGYIIGTVHPSWQVNGSFIYFDGAGYNNEIIHTVNWSDNTTYNISIFAPKGVTVSTDSNYGTYNLTVYEWK